MHEHLTVVTRKGQVTLPAPIRRALGIERGDKVAFVLNAGEVRLLHKGSVAARTAGAFKTAEPPVSAEELRMRAELAWAQDAVERGGS